MKRFLILLSVLIASASIITAGNEDYTLQIRKQALARKQAEAKDKIEKLSNMKVEDNDEQVHEKKLRQKDSLMLCAKSELLAIQMEIAELESNNKQEK